MTAAGGVAGPARTAVGGYRWVVLAACWAAFTMTSVDRSTWGPAAGAVGHSLGVSLAALGIFATAYYLGYLVSNLGGGVLVDRFGPRALLAVSGVGAGAGMIAFGSVTGVAAGLALQAAVGLLAGVDFAAGLRMISEWFPPARSGLAFGLFVTATSLGTLVANAVVPSLLLTHGWGASYRVFGTVTVVVGVLCLLLVRPPPRRARTTAPTVPDGSVPEGAVPEGAGSQSAAAEGPGLDSGPGGRAWPDARALLGNRDLLLLGLAGFGGLWGTYGFVTWSNTLMTRGAGIPPVRAGLVVTIFAAVALVVKPLIGGVCDRLGLGLRLPILAVLVCFAAALLVFGRLHTWTAFLWVAPLLGIGAYAYSPLTAAITPLLSGRAVAGSAAGLVNGFWQLGSVLVPAVVGPVYAATRSFGWAFATLAAGPALGAVVMWFVREPRRDDRPGVTVDPRPGRSCSR